MPSGLMPTYQYVPPQVPNTGLRTCSSRRGRLTIGGTYFRSRDPGLQANNITVEVLQVTAPTGPDTGEAYCIVTNKNLKFDENVIGPVETSILDLKGTYQDLWIIDQLDTAPRTQYYSISCQIAFARQQHTSYTLPPGTLLPPFTFDKLYVDAGKLSVKTARNDAPVTSGSTVSIAMRTRIYQLSAITVTPPPTEPPTDPPPAPVTGWDIANLRSQINATNPWIEMLERSGDSAGEGGGPPIPNPNPPDVQDTGVDADVLSPFPATNLDGGDGLPATPTPEKTGPSRSIVFVNYGEKPNGVLGEHNTVYEWVGDSATAGIWQSY